jgi:hypothetical protein
MTANVSYDRPWLKYCIYADCSKLSSQNLLLVVEEKALVEPTHLPKVFRAYCNAGPLHIRHATAVLIYFVIAGYITPQSANDESCWEKYLSKIRRCS